MTGKRGALILNEVLPEALRLHLEATAKSEDVTLNDAAGAILATYFGLKWEYSGKPYRPMAEQSAMAGGRLGRQRTAAATN